MRGFITTGFGTIGSPFFLLGFFTPGSAFGFFGALYHKKNC
jgi:hypothetical protein